MKSPVFTYKITFAAIFSLFIYLPNSIAQSSPKRLLLAISKVDHVLVVLDPLSLKTIARIPVGADPHEVAVSTDGKTAYVSNPGYGSFHELNIIDLTALKALPSFDTKPLYGPHGLVYSGGKLWLTAQGSKAIGRFDPQKSEMEWSVGTGQNTTHMIHVSPDEKHVYTTNVESGTVSIFENLLVQPAMPPTGVMPAAAKPRMDWIQTLVSVGQGAEGFDVSPDEKELWTATPKGILSIINLHDKKVVHTIDLKLPGAHRMKFTPDGKHFLAVSVRTGELVFYDVKSRKEIKRIRIGHGAGMMMDALGSRAFISCTPDNFIAIIDLKTMELSGKLDIGGRPDGMAIAVQY